MIKDFLLVHAGPTVPSEDVRDYLQFRHAPLALSVPVVAREMKLYTMNHVVDHAAPRCYLYRPVAELTTIVEHMFGGWEGMARISADPQYCALVRPDEAYMIGHLMAGAPQFVAIDRERPIFSSSLPTCARVFDFVRRPASISREAFLDGLDKDAVWAAENPHYRAAVAKRVDSLAGSGWVADKSEATSYGTEAENFDAVVEVWIADFARFGELINEQRERRAAFCDPERSFTAITEEHRIIN